MTIMLTMRAQQSMSSRHDDHLSKQNYLICTVPYSDTVRLDVFSCEKNE